MTAFDDAADALFADENMRKDGSYTPPGGGESQPVTILFSAPWRERDYAATGAVVCERVALIRLAQIANPAKGGVIIIGCVRFSIEKSLPDDQGVCTEVTLKLVKPQ
jgi:hypothetical protein